MHSYVIFSLEHVRTCTYIIHISLEPYVTHSLTFLSIDLTNMICIEDKISMGNVPLTSFPSASFISCGTPNHICYQFIFYDTL